MMNVILLAADEETTTYASIAGIIVGILLIVAMWRIFQKAGEAGWKSIIPLYNLYTFVKIIDGNGWKFLLFIIPVVGFIYGIILNFRMAKAFGKGFLFGIGLTIIPNLFTLILGFGSAEYNGPQ